MILNITSIQAPNADAFVEQLAEHLSSRLAVETNLISGIPWREREELIDLGEAHVSWLCGLPYIWKVDRPDSGIELLAAAVMEGSRYMDRPVYYSDVVVRADSPYTSFADLEGTRWAYNEPNSHSGYNVVRYHLATLGELYGYFGEVQESGSHLASLEMLLGGEIDAAAIDSTVLESEQVKRPDLTDQLRVVESLGPSPIPPWTVSKELPPAIRYAVRQIFLEMHRDEEGASILQAAKIKRFEAVTDSDYDPIREMEHTAAWVESL